MFNRQNLTRLRTTQQHQHAAVIGCLNKSAFNPLIYRLQSFQRVTTAGNSEMETLTVRGDVNLIWQFGHVDLKTVLHIVQSLGVGLIRHKGYSQAFGSKPTSTGNLTGTAKARVSYIPKTNPIHKYWLLQCLRVKSKHL